MIKKAFDFYLDSFRGFRSQVWWITFITLVNRSGTMVVPFLSLYLTADVGLSLEQVAWIMTSFGAGSVIGAWLGGKLTDRFGFYPVMWISLVGTGFLFFGLQCLKSFEVFCAGIFAVMIVSDTYRPALFVALRTYSKPENRTRSVTLIRLAINLGFSLGPAAGGLIIAKLGYNGLFWVDGISCILAGLLFLWKLDKRDAVTLNQENTKTGNSNPYKDWPYLRLILAMVLIGFAFLQYFSTIPLYYRDVHHLSEQSIGLLLGANGFLIFLIEMPLIKYTEQAKFSILSILLSSALLIAMSFLVLNVSTWLGVLVIGMILMTIGEMLNFPFMNRVALDRSDRGNPGAYMALYTMSWSISHIIGHNTGLQLISHLGFGFTWYFMTGILLLAMLLLWSLKGNLLKVASNN